MDTTERTLEVFTADQKGGRPVFVSRGRWLHPLFELEEYLRRESLDPGGLVLHDKIVGRAAAMLIVRLGIRRLRAGILSLPGRQVLEEHGLDCEYGQLVERILCLTEELLAGITDLDQAYTILRERAGR